MGEWDALFEDLDVIPDLAKAWVQGLGFHRGAPADVLIRLFEHRMPRVFLGRRDLPPGVLDAAMVYPSKEVFVSAIDYARPNSEQWARLLRVLPPSGLRDILAEMADERAAYEARPTADRPPHPDARPPATPEEIEAFAAAVVDIAPDAHTHALWWVVDLHGDGDAMRQLAGSPILWIRRSVARASHLPPDVVELLARDEDRVVRLFLAESCDDAPADMLLDVWTWWRGSFSYPDRPRRHPNFPREGLLRFAGDPRPRMRVLVLDDPAVTSEVVDRLSRDPDEWVRIEAAQHPLLSTAAALRLAEDASCDVRSRSYRSPALPIPQLISFLRSDNTAEAAAQNPLIPAAVLHRMIDLAESSFEPSKPYPLLTPSPSPR